MSKCTDCRTTSELVSHVGKAVGEGLCRLRYFFLFAGAVGSLAAAAYFWKERTKLEREIARIQELTKKAECDNNELRKLAVTLRRCRRKSGQPERGERGDRQCEEERLTEEALCAVEELKCRDREAKRELARLGAEIGEARKRLCEARAQREEALQRGMRGAARVRCEESGRVMARCQERGGRREAVRARRGAEEGAAEGLRCGRRESARSRCGAEESGRRETRARCAAEEGAAESPLITCRKALERIRKMREECETTLRALTADLSEESAPCILGVSNGGLATESFALLTDESFQLSTEQLRFPFPDDPSGPLSRPRSRSPCSRNTAPSPCSHAAAPSPCGRTMGASQCSRTTRYQDRTCQNTGQPAPPSFGPIGAGPLGDVDVNPFGFISAEREWTPRMDNLFSSTPMKRPTREAQERFNAFADEAYRGRVAGRGRSGSPAPPSVCRERPQPRRASMTTARRLVAARRSVSGPPRIHVNR